MFNILQLYLLLPLIGPYVPNDVINFIAGLDLTLVSFYFFEVEDWDILVSMKNTFSYSQSNSYLYLLSFKDGSTAINLINV